MTDKHMVDDFLNHLKGIIAVWDIFFLDSRPKNNLQDLSDLGITAGRRKEIIQELTTEDYCEGPLPETQYRGKEMWIFGVVVKKTVIYIKLTVLETNSTLCISFHKAEHKMSWPFKNQKP